MTNLIFNRSKNRQESKVFTPDGNSLEGLGFEYLGKGACEGGDLHFFSARHTKTDEGFMLATVEMQNGEPFFYNLYFVASVPEDISKMRVAQDMPSHSSQNFDHLSEPTDDGDSAFFVRVENLEALIEAITVYRQVLEIRSHWPQPIPPLLRDCLCSEEESFDDDEIRILRNERISSFPEEIQKRMVGIAVRKPIALPVCALEG
jgi:hypothetical protein